MPQNIPAEIKSYVEAVASSEKPRRPSKDLRGLARHMASFDVPRKSRVLVVSGRDAEEHVATAMRAWCEQKETVIPLKTGRMFGVEQIDFHAALMRLACPFTDFSKDIEHLYLTEDPPRWALIQAKGHEAASRRIVGMLASYGGEHLRVRASRLDVEAYSIDLQRSARDTHEAPGAFLQLVDDLSLAMAKDLKNEHPVFVVHLDGLDACGLRVFDMLQRASRVLAHERVVFLASYLGGLRDIARDTNIDIISCDG